MPESLATEITDALSIPTIGIGAGVATNGQVLVWQDLLGLNQDFQPKFVKQYLDGKTLITNALNAYHQEVKCRDFPTDAHCFKG